MYPYCTYFEKCGESFIFVYAFGAMMLSFATLTFGTNTGVGVLQYSVAASSK